MNIIIRGDEDKGFSSTELSSSLFRETGEKGSAVWNYHHHLDMGKGLDSMNLSPPSPGEIRNGFSSMEPSSSSLFGEMLENNSAVWTNKYTL